MNDAYGYCNSMVRIAEAVVGTDVFQTRPNAAREAMEVVDCCRQEGRFDLATKLLEEIKLLPMTLADDLAGLLSEQIKMVALGDRTPLIVFQNGIDVAADKTPAIFIRGVNFAIAMSRWARSGMSRRNQDEISERLAICQSCPQFSNNHCKVCGCPCVETNQLLNKLALASEVCPLGKWK